MTPTSEMNSDQTVNFTVSVQNICSSCGFPLEGAIEKTFEENAIKISVEPCKVCSSDFLSTIERYISEVRSYISSPSEKSRAHLKELTTIFEEEIRGYFSH